MNVNDEERQGVAHRIIESAIQDLDAMLNTTPNYERDLFHYILSYQAHPEDKLWVDLIDLEDPDHDYQIIVQMLCNIKEIYSKSAWAKCMYARSLWPSEAYHAAIKELIEAIALRPSETMSHVLLGETYYLQGSYEDALSPLDKALSLSPNFVNALACKGYCLKYLADDGKNMATSLRKAYYANAFDAFKKAAKLAPNREPIYAVEAREIKLALSKI